MKELYILHLSDIHIDKENQQIEEMAEKIIDIFSDNKYINCNNLLIFVTGDIAFSGKVEEYEKAQKFFDRLLELCNKKIKKVKIFMVPGNHDVNYDNLIENNYENAIEEYKHFALKYDSTSSNYVLEIDGIKLCIIMIDTTEGSKIDENDQGLHKTNINTQEKFDYNDVDYTFVLMHHPYYYFDEEKSINKIYDFLKHNIDIVFSGHIHGKREEKIGNTDCLYGKDMCNNGIFLNKSIYLYKINLQNREMIEEEFVYKENMYKNTSDEKIKNIGKNRKNLTLFKEKEEKVKEFFAESSFNDMAKNFDDYFIFPCLRPMNSIDEKREREINEYDELEKKINESKCIAILGSKNSSKTTLLKKIYKEMLKNNKIPIFIDGKDIHLGVEKASKIAFEDFYVDFGTEYEKFKRIEKSKKILLIDNISNCDDALHFTFLSEAIKQYDTVIYTTDIEINLKINPQLSLLGIEQYKIEPFFKDKRDKLIKKVVGLLIKENVEIEEKIINALDSFKQHYLKQPYFLILLIKFFIGGQDVNDKMVFSKMFEFNLNKLIANNRKILTNEHFIMILEEISYYIYKNQSLYIDEINIINIIKDYLNVQGHDEVSINDVKKVLLDSKIIYNIKDNYYFSERVYYSYFVARKIKRNCEEGFDEFENLLKFLCFNNNEEIALFIIYLFDSGKILKVIVDNMYVKIGKIDEYKRGSIRFLEGKYKIKEKFDLEAKTDVSSESTKKEKIQYRNAEENKIINIVKYDKDTVLTNFQNILSLLSALVLISRAFSSFEHLINKEEKQKCVEIMFKMPLCIFSMWAKDIDFNLDNMLKIFVEFKNFIQEKNIDEFEGMEHIIEIINQMTPQQYLEKIYEMTINTLLELINIPVAEGSRENTNLFIDEFIRENDNNEYYKTEYLLSLEKRKKNTAFVKQSTDLFKTKDNNIKYLIKKIAHHFLMHNEIKYDQRQTINQVIFNNNITEVAYFLNKDIIRE